MAVLIENRQNRLAIRTEKIRRQAQVVLDALDCPEGELSILIVDDDHMAELNSAYRNRPGPTNVIAFAMREGPFGDLTPDLLGDVVLSADTLQREAEEAKTTFEHRLAELLIHGILHLFGYDHEQSDEAEHRMESRSMEIIARMEADGLVSSAD